MPTKRTVKRAKSAKRTSTPKAKTSGFSVQVRALESCLAADHAKLKKIYPKALSDVEKAIVRKVQELKKAKSKAKPAAKGSKPGANLLKAKVALNILEKAIDALKVEKNSLQAGHKRFTALHKANQQAEKIWVKNISKLTRKSKPKAKRKVVRKTAVSESRAVLH
ncbi:MAG TPA: hypothetical protein VHE99_12055 [Gammaproteobacteria bacterium]|nr:hypothetical protein [Gammaproteobacteria bacterium]